MRITERTARRVYERQLAPRSLLRTLWQKSLHILARFCIPPGPRLALYRELSCDESVVDRALGRDLVGALGKLARPERGGVLQATASSYLTDRLAVLGGEPSPRAALLVDVVLAATFGGALLLGVFETISHTACCFVPVT